MRDIDFNELNSEGSLNSDESDDSQLKQIRKARLLGPDFQSTLMYYQKMNLPKRFKFINSTVKKKKQVSKVSTISQVVTTEEMEKIEVQGKRIKTISQIQVSITDTLSQIRHEDESHITDEQKDELYCEKVIEKSKESQFSMDQNLLRRDFSFGNNIIDQASPRRLSAKNKTNMKNVIKKKLLNFSKSPVVKSRDDP